MNRMIVLALMSGSLAFPAVATQAEESQPAQTPTVKPAVSNSEKTPKVKPAVSNSEKTRTLKLTACSAQPDAPQPRATDRVIRVATKTDRCGRPLPAYYPPLIVLKEKKDSVKRDIHGAGNVYPGGTVAVKADENLLLATLADTANAYAYALCHSHAGACLHLEQQFEVVPCDPGQNVALDHGDQARWPPAHRRERGSYLEVSFGDGSTGRRRPCAGARACSPYLSSRRTGRMAVEGEFRVESSGRASRAVSAGGGLRD